ncbi:hypothetical protein [Metabacillus sediminilitoris]|uniref:Uncharacterized protein n=1 Tax=Metabacillus sediminilitoris TaxID=2567941 RepID=A0A4S4C5A5_9BACI|nr:hypothetical protein [Metabacillus sediminilitoris]QGQ45289.1 hypothetical protein GMB29_08485 [Metabacillus sediminilitoris]THF82414.1 hypothetical protein E6W99_03005 [Metabacillus sediminilitoris]
MMKPIRLSIQFLILMLLVLAMVGTFVGSIVSSIVVSKNNLENNYLVENQYYLEKLAHAIDDLFENMFHHLTIERFKDN